MAELTAVLEDLNVEHKYHALIAELTAGDAEFLGDVKAEDFEDRLDADGVAVTPPVARGIVRKLDGTVHASKPTGPVEKSVEASVVPTLMRNASRKAANSAGDCSIALLRDSAVAGTDSSLVRCCLRGQLSSNSRERRRKVLAIVLDQSGSMAGAMWRRVVEAVVGVVTDDLLQDSRISVAFVVYSDEAREVPLPSCASELRDILLSRAYAPRGGTSFKAAFELAQRVIERELAHHIEAGGARGDVDVATLLFTDGEDTSVKGRLGRYGVRLVDNEASSEAARKAGDAFKKSLQKTGCPAYSCIAAFGADHDPDQCQYLSDRYFYINRGEILADVLAGGLGALLKSAGQCSVRLHLPVGVVLEEPLPETLALDADGHLDHHVWLRANGTCEGTISSVVEVAGSIKLQGSVDLRSTTIVPPGSFEKHMFLVDFMGLQLRRVALELCGKVTLSAEQLGALRTRLTNVKDRLQATKDQAGTTVGVLRGRAALRERLAEVEGLRERLSYALGQFDEADVNDQRTIGTVAIDAILRDAGQHVPQGPLAAALARRADEAATLPAMEELSEFGREYTTDAYSCCNAQELASQGDALFFLLSDVRPAPNGGFFAAEISESLISYEAFVLLSRGSKQAIKGVSSGTNFTHCGIPLYVTPRHFLRAQLLVPEALQRLTSAGVLRRGHSERQFLSLLGRAVFRGEALSEGQAAAALGMARAVHAVLASVNVEETGDRLLDTVIEESERFIESSQARAETQDLYAVAAAGLLAPNWDAEKLQRLGEAVVEECLRRRMTHALRSSGEAQRLYLAWALLGPADTNASWMDSVLPCPDASELSLDRAAFNPFTAPDELEALEAENPSKARPRPAGAAALLSILSAKVNDTNPAPQDWSAIRMRLPAWGRMVQGAGGLDSLWRCLDNLMVSACSEGQASYQRCLGALRGASQAQSLRGAFADMDSMLATATTTCLSTTDAKNGLRLGVAAALRAAVERRTALVCKYPITGAAFPRLESHTGETVSEVWGAPANPTDPALHHKAMLRVWRRTMKAGITMTVKEALADKEYRKRGGKFAFPSPLDTFIRGLHRRTMDLHRDWRQRLQKETSGEAARCEAVAEMLLRLRWDNSDDAARAKLSQIVARIWDDLEGVNLTGRAPLSSALWLNDAGDALAGCERSMAVEAVPEASAQPKDIHEVVEAVPDDENVVDTRIARDGSSYTREDFMNYYGSQRGQDMWDEAQSTHEAAALPGAARDVRLTRVEAARRAMDDGLQASLDGLSTELRQRMDAFAEGGRQGSRVKLPLSLNAKQRKAIHLWAEMQGLEHKSFGYRGRRRLHLSINGIAEVDAGQPDEEFDYDAWNSEEEEDEDDQEN